MGSKFSRTTTMAANSPEVQKLIKEIIAKDKVVIFSKTTCPYCRMAKEVRICYINCPLN